MDNQVRSDVHRAARIISNSMDLPMNIDQFSKALGIDGDDGRLAPKPLYDVLHTTVSTWVATKGQFATFQALVSSLRTIGVESAEEKIQVYIQENRMSGKHRSKKGKLAVAKEIVLSVRQNDIHPLTILLGKETAMTTRFDEFVISLDLPIAETFRIRRDHDGVYLPIYYTIISKLLNWTSRHGNAATYRRLVDALMTNGQSLAAKEVMNSIFHESDDKRGRLSGIYGTKNFFSFPFRENLISLDDLAKGTTGWRMPSSFPFYDCPTEEDAGDDGGGILKLLNALEEAESALTGGRCNHGSRWYTVRRAFDLCLHSQTGNTDHIYVQPLQDIGRVLMKGLLYVSIDLTLRNVINTVKWCLHDMLFDRNGVKPMMELLNDRNLDMKTNEEQLRFLYQHTEHIRNAGSGEAYIAEPFATLIHLMTETATSISQKQFEEPLEYSDLTAALSIAIEVTKNFAFVTVCPTISDKRSPKLISELGFLNACLPHDVAREVVEEVQLARQTLCSALTAPQHNMGPTEVASLLSSTFAVIPRTGHLKGLAGRQHELLGVNIFISLDLITEITNRAEIGSGILFLEDTKGKYDSGFSVQNLKQSVVAFLSNQGVKYEVFSLHDNIGVLDMGMEQLAALINFLSELRPHLSDDDIFRIDNPPIGVDLSSGRAAGDDVTEEKRHLQDYYDAVKRVKYYKGIGEIGVAIIDTGINNASVDAWMALHFKPSYYGEMKMYCAIHRPQSNPAYTTGMVDYYDDHDRQHGTSVAMIAANLCPLNARIHVIKAIPKDCSTTNLADLERAFEHVFKLIVDENVRVVNFSINANGEQPWLNKRIRQIREKGAIFVVSAGNYDAAPPEAGNMKCPATAGSIAVGMHSLHPVCIPPMSCGGCEAGVFAPGVALLQDDKFDYGTSYATPIVAAAFAYL